MKKLMFIAVLTLLASCGEPDNERFDRFMSELECPVILIGKTDKAVAYPSIVVKDGNGRIRTLQANNSLSSYGLPSSIADSRNVGDTLKNCK